ELDKNMQKLKIKLGYLSAEENDINAGISNAMSQPWKRPKNKVEIWLRDVQQSKDDVQRLEQQVVGERNVSSSALLGKHIAEKTQEVTELQEKGSVFGGLLIDELPTGRLLIPPMKDFVKSTKARNTENVWECLMNVEHIHNELYKEKGKFDTVYWVTVSKAFSITKLQSDIAKALNLRFRNDEDETIRASELYAALSRIKNYVLILDDLWEAFPLARVGILEPTRCNGCKIVLTTRSLDVCRKMDCTTVKVELLTEQEALTLFLSKAVENDTVLAPEVEVIAAEIAKECARLPLAIVIVAGSLRGLKGIREWRNALNELISSTKDASDDEKFTLTSSKIEELPEGIEELVNLRKLDLSNNNKLGPFPSWKLRRLSKLQYLRIDGTRAEVSAEDLLCLRQLKVVAVHFHNVQELTRYVTSHQFQGLEKYCLIVGTHCWQILVDPGKSVCISSESVPFGIGVDQLVLPSDIDYFWIDGFHDPISLSSIPCLKDARDLRRCEICRWNGLESIFSSSSFSEDGLIPLGTIERLDLSCLPRFRVLFDGIAPPHNIYLNLKQLSLIKCDTLKNIFPVQLLENFPNLERLVVRDSRNVEDIIVEEEEMNDWGHHRDDSNKISLPKLKFLNLGFLSRLKSIYNGMMVCPSIEVVDIVKCPMLRRLPLSLHMDSDQATTPPALKNIIARKEWWESLEWDDPLTKTKFQPYFKDFKYG
ncbi:hypothetical protein C3L33_21063, partial [Rhododendron williamsianum]